MTESPVQVEIATSSTPTLPLANGLVASSSSTSTFAPPAGSTFLSARRPRLKLILSSEDQVAFSAAIRQARSQMTSDAAKLPASTNMGLGNRPAPTKAVAPASRAQPIAQSERAMIPTNQENENASRVAHAAASHNWEEDDAEPRAIRRAPKSNAIFLQAIPCIFTANVKSATTFYKDILGFEVLGKPDTTLAILYRSPPQVAPVVAKRSTGKLTPPPGSIQINLRIAPMGSDGVRVKPPPAMIQIRVNDVDEVFKEITMKWSKFQPKEDEYFPTHLFGEAKILAKPQNKAWGTRELHIIDGDENKIFFFKELY